MSSRLPFRMLQVPIFALVVVQSVAGSGAASAHNSVVPCNRFL